MVSLIKFATALLLVLVSALIVAGQGCQITVSSQLQTVQENYNVYTATIANIGSDAASNVLLTTDADVRKVSGLIEKHDGFELSEKTVREGGIAAGDSVIFKYKAKVGTTVVWTATCTDDASVPPTAAATSRPKEHTKEPTAKATSKATTTTKAPSKSHSTTKAPSTKTTTTQAPTSKSTTKATTTQAPAPTSKSTTKATTTQAPAPTTKATTQAPTQAPTQATTTKQGTTASSTGKVCPGLSWWAPSPMTTWQWQLTGTIDTSINVQMYDIDLFDNAVSVIEELHSQGRIVICYFSTQYENWRPDSSDFTAAVIGNPLDGWPGENYVDIRSTVVRNIMVERLNLAASKGCDGVEPDNVDGYENDSGFPLTAADQLNFNEFIASNAHAVGLSVGLKNDVDQAKTLEPFFDWALDEQCKQYDECDTLTPFITAGKAVFNCEYQGTASSVCPYMVGISFSSLIKGLDLTAAIVAQCCVDATGGCTAKAPYTCITSEPASRKRSLPAEENVTVQDNVIIAQQQQQQAEAVKTSAAATTITIAVVVPAVLALLSL